MKSWFGAGVCKLNLVIRRIGKDLQWASYVEDLNGRRSDDDYSPHIASLGERPASVSMDQSPLTALVLTQLVGEFPVYLDQSLGGEFVEDPQRDCVHCHTRSRQL